MSSATGALQTPPVTPAIKRTTSLQDCEDIHEHYVKQYVSPDSPVVYRDPTKFSLKPAGWERWPLGRYRRLVEEVRNKIDLTEFAAQESIPVEEIQHFFTVFICDAIYDKYDVAIERHKQAIIDQATEGEPTRTWTEKKVIAELVCVKVGGVELVSRKGTMVTIYKAGPNQNGRELTVDDLAYLKEHLSKDQWRLFCEPREQKRASVQQTNDNDDQMADARNNQAVDLGLNMVADSSNAEVVNGTGNDISQNSEQLSTRGDTGADGDDVAMCLD